MPTEPTAPSCPDCGGAMTPGFPLDETQGGRHPAYWVAGAPEPSFFLGTKLRGREIYKVDGFRCEACGALRLYARERRT